MTHREFIERLDNGGTYLVRTRRGAGEWSEWTKRAVYVQRSVRTMAVVTVALQGVTDFAEFDPRCHYEPSSRTLIAEDYELDIAE